MNKVAVCPECGALLPRSDAEGLCPKCLLKAAAEAHTASEDETIATTRNLTADGIKSLERHFGEYELLEEIARGGMGVVYKARHQKLNRISALKMIVGGRFSSDEEVQRFQIEAEAAARLDHPGIVPIYEIGEHDGQPFFAMKFVEGGSLADRIDDVRGDLDLAIQILAKVARAVHHGHQRGVLHRDLKPANILIDAKGEPLVADFGLAKSTTGDSDLTQSGAILGTPSYMPPEQASGKATVTTAADIYSLGAILYELLTGQPPYQGSSPVDTVMQVLQDPVRSPNELNATVDRDLALICMKCLQREPDHRYSSSAALAHDLENWLAGNPISVRPPTLQSLVARWLRHNRQIAYMFFAILAGTTVALTLLTSVLGGISTAADVYEYFPDLERPQMFSWATSLAGVAGIGSFLLLLTLGLFAAITARPTSIKASLRVGSFTGLVCLLLLWILVGWLWFVGMTAKDSQKHVSLLAKVAWPASDSEGEEARRTALNAFQDFEAIRAQDKAKVFTKMVLVEQLTGGWHLLLMWTQASCLATVPVVYGTVLAGTLLRRQLPMWLVTVRYIVAWLAMTIAYLFTAIAALNWLSKSNWQFSLFPISAFAQVVGATIVAYLCMRRWRNSIPTHAPE